MFRTPINKITLISRRPENDPHHEGLLPGDVIEIPDVAVYAVDPKTRQSLPALQQFEVKEDGSSLGIVKRVAKWDKFRIKWPPDGPAEVVITKVPDGE